MLAQRHPAAELSRLQLELARDAIPTLRVLQNHEMFAEPGTVLLERADLDGPSCATARRKERVAVGYRPGGDLLNQGPRPRGHGSDREGHPPAAVQEQEPSDRPAEHEL